MKLQVTKELKKSIYSTKFELIEISETDREMLDDRAGTVELNIGGNITKKEMADDGSGGQVEKEVVLLKQGDNYIKFDAGMPVLKTFGIAQYGEPKAQEIAEAYTEMITKRIVDLVTDMKLHVDTFSSVDQIPLT